MYGLCSHHAVHFPCSTADIGNGRAMWTNSTTERDGETYRDNETKRKSKSTRERRRLVWHWEISALSAECLHTVQIDCPLLFPGLMITLPAGMKSVDTWQQVTSPECHIIMTPLFCHQHHYTSWQDVVPTQTLNRITITVNEQILSMLHSPNLNPGNNLWSIFYTARVCVQNR